MNENIAGALALAALMSLPSVASAQAPAGFAGRTRLDYGRAPGAEACPDAGAFRDLVVAKIEGAADPFTPAGPNVLRVTMERQGAGHRAAMEVFDAAGRSLGMQEQAAPSCAQAARALAVDASLLFVTRPAAPAATAIPPAAVPSVPAPPPPPPPARPGRRWRFEVGAGAGASAGFSPFIAPAFGGFVGFRVPLGEGERPAAFALSIEGRGDLEARGDALTGPQGQAGQLHASWAGGTLAPCLHSSRFFLGCMLLTVGEVRASLGDGAAPGSQGALFIGLGGRAGVELPILRGTPTLAVRVALDGWITLVRPGARVDGDIVWTAPQGAGTLGAYVVALF